MGACINDWVKLHFLGDKHQKRHLNITVPWAGPPQGLQQCRADRARKPPWGYGAGLFPTLETVETGFFAQNGVKRCKTV